MQHRKIWHALDKIFDGTSGRKRLLLTQEWPLRTDLWKDSTYLKVSKRIGLVHRCRVDRHALDTVYKEWVFVSNSPRMAQLLDVQSAKVATECTKSTTENSGYYSRAVAEHFLKCVRAVIHESDWQR